MPHSLEVIPTLYQRFTSWKKRHSDRGWSRCSSKRINVVVSFNALPKTCHIWAGKMHNTRWKMWCSVTLLGKSQKSMRDLCRLHVFLFQIWDLQTSRALDVARWAVLLWSSRNVLWTMKLHPDCISISIGWGRMGRVWVNCSFKLWHMKGLETFSWTLALRFTQHLSVLYFSPYKYQHFTSWAKRCDGVLSRYNWNCKINNKRNIAEWHQTFQCSRPLQATLCLRSSVSTSYVWCICMAWEAQPVALVTAMIRTSIWFPFNRNDTLRWGISLWRTSGRSGCYAANRRLPCWEATAGPVKQTSLLWVTGGPPPSLRPLTSPRSSLAKIVPTPC